MTLGNGLWSLEQRFATSMEKSTLSEEKLTIQNDPDCETGASSRSSYSTTGHRNPPS